MDQKKITEKDKILNEVTTIAAGKIPVSFSAFGNIIWKVFQLGEKYSEELNKEMKQAFYQEVCEKCYIGKQKLCDREYYRACYKYTEYLEIIITEGKTKDERTTKT